MKKNKTVKKKRKLTPNTVLNEVGGAVKINWIRDENGELCTKNYGYHIYKALEQHTHTRKYFLNVNYHRVGAFKKLAKAKEVAQLIYEG